MAAGNLAVIFYCEISDVFENSIEETLYSVENKLMAVTSN